MPLSKLKIDNAVYLKDSSGIDVLHVNESHALVMAAGYLKFKYANSTREGIFFRGQRTIYKGLSPTLYRGISSLRAQNEKHAALSKVVRCFVESGRVFGSFGDYAHEPLLQHYGINTTWMDLVDNVWIALWFACHRAKVVGERGQFVHFERRIPSAEEQFAYLLLVAADLNSHAPDQPGYYCGDTTELVDLRMATPSVFLRPHAQHGLLFRKKGGSKGRALDYSSQLRGVIRVDLVKALDWLGSGKMVNAHSLFPPPFYDKGYQILLTSGVDGDKRIGTISHIGA